MTHLEVNTRIYLLEILEVTIKERLTVKGYFPLITQIGPYSSGNNIIGRVCLASAPAAEKDWSVWALVGFGFGF